MTGQRHTRGILPGLTRLSQQACLPQQAYMPRSVCLPHQRSARLLAVLLVLVLMAGFLGGCATTGDSNDNPAPISRQDPVFSALPVPAVHAGLTEGFEPIAETATLELHSRLDTGEIAVVSKVDGSIWYSNPQNRDEDKIAKGAKKHALASQIIAVFSNSIQAGAEVTSAFNGFQKGKVTSEKVDGGIKFVFEFTKENFTVPVLFRLKDDYFEARVVTAEIDEREDCEVLSIELLPYFGASGEGDEGYLFVPDGTGALIHLNNGRTSMASYEEMVYGPNALQPREFEGPAEQPVLLPVFGSQVNGHAFLAVITGNEGNCAIKARVNGKNNASNAVQSELYLRSSANIQLPAKNWISKTISVVEKRRADAEDYSIRYYLISGEATGYTGMAGQYRSYLQSEGSLPTEMIDMDGDIPFYLDLYGAITKKVPVLGIPIEQPVSLTTFKQGGEILDQLAAGGVKSPIIRFSAWEKDSYLEKIPAKARIERRVGSTSTFKALSQKAEGLGGAIFLNADFTNVSKLGNGFTRFSSPAMNMVNIPFVATEYDLSVYRKDFTARWYLTAPRHLNAFIQKYLDRYEKLGTGNLAIDAIGSMVYSDFGLNGTSRADVPGLYRQALANAEARTPNLMLSGANAYALPYADYLAGIPTGSSQFALANETVPFYQIVLHGIVPMGSAPINLYSNPEDALLSCIEMGMSPTFSWIGSDPELLKNTRLNHLYSSDYRNWLEFASDGYATINEVLARVKGMPITGHANLAAGVSSTTYGSQLTILVNYNDSPVTVAGLTIQANSFAIREGDA